MTPTSFAQPPWIYTEPNSTNDARTQFALQYTTFPHDPNSPQLMGWCTPSLGGDRNATRAHVKRATDAFLEEHPEACGVACVAFETQSPPLGKEFMRGPFWTLHRRTVGTLKTMRSMLRSSPSKALLLPVRETLAIVSRSLNTSTLSDEYTHDILSPKSTPTSFREAVLCLRSSAITHAKFWWDETTLQDATHNPDITIHTILRHGRICAVLCTSRIETPKAQTTWIFDAGASPSGALVVAQLVEHAAEHAAHRGVNHVVASDGFERWLRASYTERGLREVSTAQVWWRFRDAPQSAELAAFSWSPSTMPLHTAQTWLERVDR